jgi:hypothetical protein
MIDGATKSFVQAYNAQAAVDSQAQIIVACDVTTTAADAEQFGPLLDQVRPHVGAAPRVLSADAGYFSEANLALATEAGGDVYAPPDRRGIERRATMPCPIPRARMRPLTSCAPSCATPRAARSTPVARPSRSLSLGRSRRSAAFAASPSRPLEGAGRVAPHLPHA